MLCTWGTREYREKGCKTNELGVVSFLQQLWRPPPAEWR